MIGRFVIFVLVAALVTGVGSVVALAGEVKFAKGSSAVKIPFRLFNNHIYLQVSVNGSRLCGEPLSWTFTIRSYRSYSRFTIA
jgi:hypothetical protein